MRAGCQAWDGEVSDATIQGLCGQRRRSIKERHGAGGRAAGSGDYSRGDVKSLIRVDRAGCRRERYGCGLPAYCELRCLGDGVVISAVCRRQRDHEGLCSRGENSTGGRRIGQGARYAGGRIELCTGECRTIGDRCRCPADGWVGFRDRQRTCRRAGVVRIAHRSHDGVAAGGGGCRACPVIGEQYIQP